MKTEIKVGKTYYTKNGKATVRIVAIDPLDTTGQPVIGWLSDPDKALVSYSLDGIFFKGVPSGFDLNLERIRQRAWINVYKQNLYGYFEEESAINAAAEDILARVEMDIEVEVGRGLTKKELGRLTDK